MATRVLIVDDHAVVRDGLRALLGTRGFEVVGVAADGVSALREAQLLRPDVVLMDVNMPVLDGVETTRRMLAAIPDAVVLMLTMYDDDAAVFTAMRAGARGYLLKGASQDELVSALNSAVAGQLVFGPEVAARVLDLFAATPRGQPDAPRTLFPQLTEREAEILDLLAAGRRTADIAATLQLSSKTVSNALTSVFRKLEVRDRGEAIVRAREAGLGRGPA
jgi:DNA-binding NarL/FixJ family response regulator